MQNPGLRSRFPFQMTFPNYTVEQLMDMAELMVKERDYTLSNRAKTKMKQHLSLQLREDQQFFSNGRYVRNLIEEAIRQHSIRLLRTNHYSIQALTSIQDTDFLLDE